MKQYEGHPQHHPITGTVLDGMTQAKMFACSEILTGSVELGELWVKTIHAAVVPKKNKKNLRYWTNAIIRYCEAVEMEQSSDKRTREMGAVIRKESAKLFPILK